jgi:hypothetical protein
MALCATLGAAFAIFPVGASASPALTEEGKLLETGKLLQATGGQTSLFNSAFITVTCNKFSMTGSVTENTGSSTKGTITKASFENSTETDCSSNVGASRVTIPGLESGSSDWCIAVNSALGANKGQVEPHSCGSTGGQFTFVINNTPGAFFCRYRRTSNVNVTFNTNVTPVTVSFAEEPLYELEPTSSTLCSPAGTLSKLSFTLETDGTNVGLTIS